MKAEIKFECKKCINDITLDITIVGKTMPSISKVRESANLQGWSIGRDCYCPSCLRELPAHCSTCEHFEGNKSMGASICRRDGNFTTNTDYCDHHEPIRCYRNPIPQIE